MKKRRTLDVAELGARLELSEELLRGFEPRYRSVEIPKRSGGSRVLSVPDDATMELQRVLQRRLLRRLRVHPAATGFVRGRSIVENALPHVGRAVVVKLDLVEFFPHTRADRVAAYFRKIGWDADAAALLTRLVTEHGGLPQGAPTSPTLSNVVNYTLDAQMMRLVVGWRGAYTRYADDMTVSFERDRPRRVRGLVQYARKVARYHGYELNEHKTLILRRHQQQRVTGLVVNEKVQLPRSARRRLRAIEHHLREGRPATLTPDQLQGWQALQRMIRERS